MTTYIEQLQAAAAAGPQVKQTRHEVLVDGVSLAHGPGYILGDEAKATIEAYGTTGVEIRNYIAEYPACSCKKPTPTEIGPCCKVCDRITPQAAERFAPKETQ